MPRGFQRLAWLVLLTYFGIVAEAACIPGTDRVQARVRGHAWPTGFCSVYEVDGGNTNPDVAVGISAAAVEVASEVAQSGPKTAAKKEILTSPEAGARPPPLQSSQDTAPIISHQPCGGPGAPRTCSDLTDSKLPAEDDVTAWVIENHVHTLESQLCGCVGGGRVGVPIWT